MVFDVPIYQNTETRRLISQSFSLQVLVHAFYYAQSIFEILLLKAKCNLDQKAIWIKNIGYRKPYAKVYFWPYVFCTLTENEIVNQDNLMS